MKNSEFENNNITIKYLLIYFLFSFQVVRNTRKVCNVSGPGMKCTVLSYKCYNGKYMYKRVKSWPLVIGGKT